MALEPAYDAVSALRQSGEMGFVIESFYGNRCLSACRPAQWSRNAWMLFKKYVCVNPASASQHFFDPLRVTVKKKNNAMN
jgi:hypothetical protein